MKPIPLNLIIIILASTITVNAENPTQVIRGTIVDEVTGYPLPGANVILLNTDPPVGTTSDMDGCFALRDVPLGRQSIEIRYVGYQSKLIPNLLLTIAKEVVVEIKLTEQVTEFEEVTVKAFSRKDKSINDMAMISARSFSIEETERFAGSLGDPSRMVANYAGVVTQNDSRNDIIIRGNSPTGLLWRLEDIEIPNPNHFGALGTTGGPVSMLNNNLLTNSDFLTGAFPAEYGNALAGAFDLNMRSGNNQVREYTGQIGFNGFELGAEGPFSRKKSGPKASYLGNFRYSTLDVIHKLGIDIGTGAAIPEYKDFTFLIDIPGTKFGRFKIIGLLGDSYISLGREKEDTANNPYTARGTATDFGSELAVFGLSHVYYINENARFKTTLSWQTTSSTTVVDSILNNWELTVPMYRSRQSEDKMSFSTQYRQKINSRNNFNLGVIIDHYSIDYLDSVMNSDIQEFQEIINTRANMTLYRVYTQWQHKFSDKLSAYAGLNFQHLGLNSESVIEPRLSMKWSINPKHAFSLGYGKHSQMQPKIIYYTLTHDTVNNIDFTTNEDVRFTRADHFVLGYDYLVNKDFRIKLESYYQRLYKVPVKESFPEFSMVNTGDFFGIPQEDSLVNKGTGRNYGIELTVEKFLSKGYYFLLTASVFNSKYKGYDNILRNTAFNGNYVFNLLGGYELNLRKNRMLTLDMKTVWAGGRRYVPIDEALSRIENSEKRDWNLAYHDKYDDYFRTDFRIGLKINGKKTSQEWALDLQNLTGFQSLFMEVWDAAEKEIYTVYQQGFVPMMLYRIQF
ncbi:MAG: TonB-dependent receptor [Bacteroidales bacterium]|nr:TonB-dependent receptor [Bacteroidales bacterium]